MPILSTLAETQRAVITDDAFGERILVVPRVKGQVDPDRSEVEIVGVLRTGPVKDANMTEGGMAQSWRTMLSAGKAELHLDQHRYPDLVIRKDDEIRALERPGQPWFAVETFDDRNAPRLIIGLSES
ncbi:hypothetical protein [Aurantimonas sp. VKM B-3413]|uniref:hypothetical protein n=1 Tax=Aurantimonas sp. VKM B-3413 TaxID=2779401 RepID=UPI001E3F6B4D|nr:hypothetical protein [Aurantimonas sp. VKM B-3413]MCB8835943.1 hypothetical protein [Aurantimonas sp. VKM B-3413]